VEMSLRPGLVHRRGEGLEEARAGGQRVGAPGVQREARGALERSQELRLPPAAGAVASSAAHAL
jgi:hypothetical protein